MVARVVKKTQANEATDQRASDQPRDKVDRASADSMDASDPPSFQPSTAGAGGDRQSTVDEDFEKRVQHQAYLLWVEEGYPNDRAEANWHMARELVTLEDRERDAAKKQSQVIDHPRRKAG